MEFNENELTRKIYGKALGYLVNPYLSKKETLEYHRHGTQQFAGDISTLQRDHYINEIQAKLHNEGYLLLIKPIRCDECGEPTCLSVPWGRSIPAIRVVQLQPHLNNLGQVHTLAHELAHVLDDDEPSIFEKPKNEICAELFAHFYCKAHDLPVNLDDTLNYCAGYSKAKESGSRYIREGVRKAHALLNRTGILTNATH